MNDVVQNLILLSQESFNNKKQAALHKAEKIMFLT
jgi:hypothetical protein